MCEMERTVRYRVNVSRTSKGHSYDCTVEVEGDLTFATQEEVLGRSAALVAALDAKYPPQTEGSK